MEELAGSGSHGEWESVSTVWSLIGEYQKLINETLTGNVTRLNGITKKIERSITIPPQSEATGWWLEFFANLGSIVSYYSFGVPDEVVQKLSGTLSGMAFIAGQTLHGSEGLPAFEGFSINAGKFSEEFVKRYELLSSQLGRVGEILVSDRGKLAAVADNPIYAMNEEAVAAAKEGLAASGSQWGYSALLPMVYEAIGLEKGEQQNNPLPTEASKYSCEFFEHGGGSGAYNPFKSAIAGGQVTTKLPQPTLGLLVGAGSELPIQGDPESRPPTPSEELMEELWKSKVEGGLGLYKPWFFHSTFDYPSSSTKTVLCR